MRLRPAKPAELVEISDNAVSLLAQQAFAIHYELTKQSGWSTAEVHWRDNPPARELWTGIVRGILAGAAVAQAVATGQAKLSGLVGLGGATRPPGVPAPLRGAFEYGGTQMGRMPSVLDDPDVARKIGDMDADALEQMVANAADSSKPQ